MRQVHAPDQKVDRYIHGRSLVVLHSEPKQCRTIIALETAMCFASGRRYHGIAARQGRMRCGGAEGHAVELGEPVPAYCLESKLAPESLDDTFSLVISVVRRNEPEWCVRSPSKTRRLATCMCSTP